MLRSLIHMFWSALLLACLGTAALAKEAVCEVTIAGARIDGACDFVGHKGGSFDVTMQDGRRFGGARTLSLSVLRPQFGEITDSAGRSYGAAKRSGADPACWVANELSLCVRAKSDVAPLSAAPEAPVTGPRVVTGRCHMGGCCWVRIDRVVQVGEGSAAHPGRRMRAEMSYASQEGIGDNIPEKPKPDNTLWGPSAPAGYFCSRTRPAVLQEDGTWFVLPLPEVFGATEGVSNIYLNICDGVTGDDPYEAVKQFGYAAEQTDTDFASFEALIGG